MHRPMHSHEHMKKSCQSRETALGWKGLAPNWVHEGIRCSHYSHQKDIQQTPQMESLSSSHSWDREWRAVQPLCTKRHHCLPEGSALSNSICKRAPATEQYKLVIDKHSLNHIFPRQVTNRMNWWRLTDTKLKWVYTEGWQACIQPWLGRN